MQFEGGVFVCPTIQLGYQIRIAVVSKSDLKSVFDVNGNTVCTVYRHVNISTHV